MLLLLGHYTDFHTSIRMVNVTQDSGRFSD